MWNQSFDYSEKLASNRSQTSIVIIINLRWSKVDTLESRWPLLDNIIKHNFRQRNVTGFTWHIFCSTLVLLLQWRLLLVTAALLTSFKWLQDWCNSTVWTQLVYYRNTPYQLYSKLTKQQRQIRSLNSLFLLRSTSLLLFTAACTMTEAGSEL